MSRCEDFPCCGHESGCCPDFDESGRQTNMRCTYGASVPLGSRSSLCRPCLTRPEPGCEPGGFGGEDFEDFDEGFDESFEDYEGHYEDAYETDALF